MCHLYAYNNVKLLRKWSVGYKRRKLEVADEVGAIKRGPSTSTYILTDLLLAADCVYNERMIGNLCELR